MKMLQFVFESPGIESQEIDSVTVDRLVQIKELIKTEINYKYMYKNWKM